MKEKVDKKYIEEMTKRATILKKELQAQWKKALKRALKKKYTLFRVEYWGPEYKENIDSRLWKFKVSEGIGKGWFFDVKGEMPYIEGRLNEESAKILENITPMTTFGVFHIYLYDESKKRVIKFTDMWSVEEEDPFVSKPHPKPYKF